MKAGLVRIASCSALALAVVGLSACNDDPLTFDTKTATRIFTNPSVMVLNAGGVQRLNVNTLNDGFEPTFDVPSLTEGTSAECSVPVTGDVTFTELPAATGGGSAITQPIDSVLATGAEPPNKYDVTGVGLGETCLIGSFGSLSAEIPVTVVPFGITISGPSSIADGDFTTQTYTVDGINADSTANSTWDVNASYVTIAVDDTLVAQITAINSPNTVEIVRGPLGGDATLTVTSDQNGVERTESFVISVAKPIPAITTITPPNPNPGDTVTIDGAQLSILTLSGTPTIVLIGGLEVANIISESPTQIVIQAPSLPAGAYTLDVDVDGAVSIAGSMLTLASGFSAVGCGPACEAPGNASVVVPFDFSGDIVGGVTDNFFTFGVSRDMDIDFALDWSNVATDVDLLVVDGAFTVFVCTDGATGAKPEASACHTEDPGDYIFWVNVYAGPDPGAYSAVGAVAGFR